MFDKLPYTLTKGVTAMKEGLLIESNQTFDAIVYWPMYSRKNENEWLVTWPDAAERLRYREGEPFCTFLGNAIVGGSPQVILDKKDGPSLHRLAAILCDDAEAFNVLHWCVTEIGGRDE